MAGCAEYYNRLARHHAATINPPGAWVGRISTGLAMRIQLFKTAKKVRQQSATINPPGAWVGRISTGLAMRIQLFKTAKKVRQQFLRRAA
jgi:hypothetical protein